MEFSPSKHHEDHHGLSSADPDGSSVASSKTNASLGLSTARPGVLSYESTIRSHLIAAAPASIRQSPEFDTFLETAQTSISGYLAEAVNSVFVTAQNVLQKQRTKSREKLASARLRHRRKLEDLQQSYSEKLADMLARQDRAEGPLAPIPERLSMFSATSFSSASGREPVEAVDALEVDALVDATSSPSQSGLAPGSQGLRARKANDPPATSSVEGIAPPPKIRLPPPKQSHTTTAAAAAVPEQQKKPGPAATTPPPTKAERVGAFMLFKILPLIVAASLYVFIGSLFDPRILGFSHNTSSLLEVMGRRGWSASWLPPRVDILGPLLTSKAHAASFMWKAKDGFLALSNKVGNALLRSKDVVVTLVASLKDRIGW